MLGHVANSTSVETRMRTSYAVTILLSDGTSAVTTAAIASGARNGVSGEETMIAVMTATMSDATINLVSLPRSDVMTAVLNRVAIDRMSGATSDMGSLARSDVLTAVMNRVAIDRMSDA
jgi:hypothetical protein